MMYDKDDKFGIVLVTPYQTSSMSGKPQDFEHSDKVVAAFAGLMVAAGWMPESVANSMLTYVAEYQPEIYNGEFVQPQSGATEALAEDERFFNEISEDPTTPEIDNDTISLCLELENSFVREGNYKDAETIRRFLEITGAVA